MQHQSLVNLAFFNLNNLSYFAFHSLHKGSWIKSFLNPYSKIESLTVGFLLIFLIFINIYLSLKYELHLCD